MEVLAGVNFCGEGQSGCMWVFTSGMNDISALSSSVHWFCGTPLPNWAQGGIYESR